MPSRARRVIGPAVALVAVAVVATAVVAARVVGSAGPRPAPAPMPTDGPLIGLSLSEISQQRTDTTQPIFDAGFIQVANLSRQPIRVLAVAPWDGRGVTLYEVGFLAEPPKGGPGGFVGRLQADTLEAEGPLVHQDEWRSVRRAPVAVIDPCCDHDWVVGMAYVPQLAARQGRTRGLVVTYQIGDGRLFRAFLAVPFYWCAGLASSAACQALSTSVGHQFDHDLVDAPTDADLRRPGSWRGG